MSFSIRAIIQDLVAPKYRLSCSTRLWRAGLAELNRRGGGFRESGAFLLGDRRGLHRRIRRFVYYDDLDPACLDQGIVVFDGAFYGTLWQLCRTAGLKVIADVHTHPGVARQSPIDCENPMIATRGHIALIVPNFARFEVKQHKLGIYEYQGQHLWHEYVGNAAAQFFYIGFWG